MRFDASNFTLAVMPESSRICRIVASTQKHRARNLRGVKGPGSKTTSPLEPNFSRWRASFHKVIRWVEAVGPAANHAVNSTAAQLPPASPKPFGIRP